MSVTYDSIVNAQKIQGDIIRKTSLTFSDTFSHLTGSTVYLKNEFEQKTGSFKIRGAYYKIKSLNADEKKHGVVAASAGNHSQGVAFASSLENIPCTIVMPKNASPAKISATRGYGANVILEGLTYDESWAHAQKISRETRRHRSCHCRPCPPCQKPAPPVHQSWCCCCSSTGRQTQPG